MRRWLILVGMLLGSAIAAMGQGSATSASGVLYVSVGPSGACTAGSVIEQLTTGSGAVYACQSISAGVGTWTTLSSGSATGTVTGVTINGTTNQISITTCAITVSGTCTLSLPSAITLPGSLSLPGQLTSTETTGTAPFVVASTTVVANLNVSSLLGATWVSPGAIGSTTASSGAFTTLSASSTVSGTGFSTYLASPPAIGGTVAAAGTFSALTDTAMTGGPFCVHETSGVLAATSSDCGSGTGTFAGLNTTGANGTNTNANPISIAPATALGGSTAYFSVLGVTADTDTAPVVNFDTATGSQQNSFRAGIDGTSQLQVCWQSGPQGEVVFGSNVACSGIYTTTYAKTVFQSGTGAHTLMRMWQASSSQTGPFVQQNTATAAGTGFDFLEGWTGVTGTDTYHTGGTKTYAIQGDGSYLMNGCSAGSYLKADGTGCSVPSGSGTVNSGTATQLAYYASTGAAVSGDTALTDNGTTAAYTGSGGFTGNSFNSPSTTAPFLATSPVPSGACTPQATKSLMTVSSDGNFYVSNNGGTCYQIDNSSTIIPTTTGGTGQNFGSSTGVLQLASGTASVSTALANGTTATTQLSSATPTTLVATIGYVSTYAVTNPCSSATIGALLYQGSSSVQCLAAPTGPAGVPNIVSTIPGSAPTYGPPGVPINTQSASSYSLGLTDRGAAILFSNNTTSTGFSVPTPTSTGYGQSNVFVTLNTGTVVLTATTSSSTVNANATLKQVGAVAGHNPQGCYWYTDNSNWWATCTLPTDANGFLAAEGIAAGSISNTALAHASTTVQGQTCTLGLSCNINSVTTAHGVALNEGSATQLGGTAAGTSNTVLHGNTGADPTFSAVSLTADVTGVLPLANMSQLFVTNAQTSTYQVVAADFVGCKTIPVSTATFTITLVASGTQPASGQCVWIINYGTGTPTIARSGQNINGAASNLTLAAGSASAPTGAYVVSDGTNYEAQIFGSGSGGGAVTSVSNSDGTITISPTTGSVVASLNLSHANTWAAVQTITNSDLALLGSSTGATTFTSANASATNYTATFPANTGTLAELNLAETFSALQTFGSNASIAGTAHGVLISENTSAVVATAAGASGTLFQGAGSSTDPSFTPTPTLGVQGTTAGSLTIAGTTGTSGSLVLNGSTSGSATLNVSATAGTLNLGSTNATVTSAGALTVASCTGCITFPQTVAGTTTSGGIPYFSTTTTLTSSALLATNAIVVGGGAGGAPATGNGDFTYATHTLSSDAAGLLDLSAQTGASSFKLPAVIGGSLLAGTSTANLSAPIVIQNTNSSNNNTSITLGVSSPGTSTGQTTLNVNGATTQGNLIEAGTGGTWASGVLSGQTKTFQVQPTGFTTLGTATAVTAGTGGGIGPTEGTDCTGVAGVDCLDANSTTHALMLNNNNTGSMPISRTACVNTTPVTVAANVTTDQILMACSFNANLLNVVGRVLKVYTAGVYSTAAASTASLTFKVKLCTVSACATGTTIVPVSTTTGATTALTASNLSWSQTSYISTQTAGASSAYESHGFMTIDLSATAATPDSVYQDTNTATVGTIDSTGALWLQITAAASAGSTSNSFTDRLLVVEVVN